MHARQVEEAGDQFHALVQGQRRANHRLRDLIEDDDRQGDEDFWFPAGQHGQRLTGSASASTHRRQRPSRLAWVLTSGTYRQQRSHFVPVARPTATPARLVNSTSETPNSVGRKSAYCFRSAP